MNRGYIKFWRKAQDSASWNRGLMYQGLIINLLTRAAWKKGSYQGRDILPGQFGAVMSHLAESLRVPRSTLQRMVAHLEADDFLKVENVGNRFVIITVVNWCSYQETEKETWAADGQPTVNQRAADGQPSYKEEEVKKIRIREGGDNARACVAPSVPEIPPERFQGDVEKSKQAESGSASPYTGPKRTDCPSKGNPQWPAFSSCWQVYPVQQGKEAAWREWMRLHDNGTLAEPYAIRDAVILLAQEDSRWQRGKVPNMAKWLNGKGWEDQPFVEPAVAPGAAPRDGPPLARTQGQKNRQNLEGIAAFVRAADREMGYGNQAKNFGGAGAHGSGLPATDGR